MPRTSTPNEVQIQHFQQKLEGLRDQAFRVLVKAQQERRILDSDDPQDIGDCCIASSSREFLLQRSSQKRRLVQLIDEALRRIDNDAFGECTSCGSRINLKRLEAMPWTERCLQCQEKFEQRDTVEICPKLPGAGYASTQLND